MRPSRSTAPRSSAPAAGGDVAGMTGRGSSAPCCRRSSLPNQRHHERCNGGTPARIVRRPHPRRVRGRGATAVTRPARGPSQTPSPSDRQTTSGGAPIGDRLDPDPDPRPASVASALGVAEAIEQAEVIAFPAGQRRGASHQRCWAVLGHRLVGDVEACPTGQYRNARRRHQYRGIGTKESIMSEIRTADGKLVVSPGRGEPQHAAVVVTLVVMIGLLASIAAVIGLLAQPDAVPVVTARGGTAELFGGGVYRYDTLFSGAGNRGTDAVTVLIAIPLLVASLFGYRRGSLRWGSMLTGALAWFLYSYATMAVGAAFNQLFLVYVALFSASLWAFMIAIRDIDITRLARAASAAATRPGGADARQRRGDRSDLARPDPGRAARGRSVAATGWLHDRGDHSDRRSRDRPGRFRGRPAHPAPFRLRVPHGVPAAPPGGDARADDHRSDNQPNRRGCLPLTGRDDRSGSRFRRSGGRRDLVSWR